MGTTNLNTARTGLACSLIRSGLKYSAPRPEQATPPRIHASTGPSAPPWSRKRASPPIARHDFEIGPPDRRERSDLGLWWVCVRARDARQGFALCSEPSRPHRWAPPTICRRRPLIPKETTSCEETTPRRPLSTPAASLTSGAQLQRSLRTAAAAVPLSGLAVDQNGQHYQASWTQSEGDRRRML
jgi:hypothetical protein